jgi:hypothetical protein
MQNPPRVAETEPRSTADLRPEEQARLFAHAIHEEGVFYNRLNFFLVFESLLFAAAISGFSGKDAPPRQIIVPVCAIGVVVSLLWWYAQVNKLVLLKALEERIKAAFTEFRETIQVANKRRWTLRVWLLKRLWSANQLLAWLIPPLFLGAWSYLLYYLLRQ